jgi:CRP-like cAMP-binding protein
MTAVDYPAGTVILREGEAGDAFYLIAEGTAQVTEGGRHLRDLGPAGSFGEIALIKGVPRTATVRASTDVRAYRLASSDFLSAVTGNPYSRVAVDRLVEELTIAPTSDD